MEKTLTKKEEGIIIKRYLGNIVRNIEQKYEPTKAYKILIDLEEQSGCRKCGRLYPTIIGEDTKYRCLFCGIEEDEGIILRKEQYFKKERKPPSLNGCFSHN